jgi:hypothetical protein
VEADAEDDDDDEDEEELEDAPSPDDDDVVFSVLGLSLEAALLSPPLSDSIAFLREADG